MHAARALLSARGMSAGTPSSASLAFALLASALVACSGSGGETVSSPPTNPDVPPTEEEGVSKAPPFDGNLQMYDLSVLFPLAEGTYTKPSAAGARGALVPEATFDAAGFRPPAEPAPGQFFGPAYADLSLVAIRVDPCFAQPLPPKANVSCENHLRLVFQQITTSNGAPYARDTGLHAFYRLTRGELVDFVRKLAALRAAQATAAENEERAPLGVHPVLARQGLGGEMAEGVRALVLEYAGASNLFRMTRFTSSGPAWSFDGVEVTPAGAPTSTPIFGLVNPAETSVSFFSGSSIGEDATLPAVVSENDLSVLAKPSMHATAPPSAKQAAFDAALRIQNPLLRSTNDVDCASCHVAFGLQKRVGERTFGLSADANPNGFARPASIEESQMELTADGLEPTDVAFNVHMFSHVGTTPTVNARVVNETALVLDYLAPIVRGD